MLMIYLRNLEIKTCNFNNLEWEIFLKSVWGLALDKICGKTTVLVCEVSQETQGICSV